MRELMSASLAVNTARIVANDQCDFRSAKVPMKKTSTVINMKNPLHTPIEQPSSAGNIPARVTNTSFQNLSINQSGIV